MVTANDGMVTAYAVGNGREYDVLIDTLTDASDRFWELRKAVFELRDLCESEDVHSEEVLEVLERHGA